MGFEDRDYYRDQDDGQPGIPGLRFNQQSIITSLIVVNVLVFLADMFSPKLPAEYGGTLWLSHFLALKADAPWQVWTFLTHGFAHASISSELGVLHIVFNLLTLFFLGRPVEEHLGRMEFLKFYLIAIVVGGLGFYLWELAVGGNGYCVGASGAVAAVVIYFIFLNPRSELLMFGVIPTPAWVVGVLFLVVNLIQAFSHSNVAWQAHLAGGAFGALYYRFHWNFSRLKMPGGGRGLKIHRPSGAVDDRLQVEADRILAKINEQGEASLTSKERRTLKKYSNQLRKQRK